jgi:transcriptional regulator with XRE-family HTH domain
MGTRTRPKPARLPEKLRQIRFSLGLSQNELINYLGLENVIAYNKISTYELATREPDLPILLKYARAAGVCVDVLIDDELELPKKLPGTPSHRRVDIAASRRRSSPRR